MAQWYTIHHRVRRDRPGLSATPVATRITREEAERTVQALNKKYPHSVYFVTPGATLTQNMTRK